MRATFIRSIPAVLLVASASASAASLAYGFNVVNFSSPDPFTFTFTTPILTQSGLSTYSFSGDFSMTDAAGDGVSASGGTLPEFWQLVVYDASNNPFVVDDVGGVDPFTGAGPHSFSASRSFDCSALTGGCAAMGLSSSFRLGAGGDRLAGTGTFSLLQQQQVPEPGTLALLGLGLAGLGLARRRRPG